MKLMKFDFLQVRKEVKEGNQAKIISIKYK